LIRALPEVFRTARLIAQRVDERHLADLDRLHAEPAVAAWINDAATGDGISEWLASSVAPHWHMYGYGLFAIYEKYPRAGDEAGAEGAAGRAGAARPFVGRAGLVDSGNDVTEVFAEKRVVELGFAIAPDARGCGYATEICGALTGLALTSLDRESVAALVRPGNAGALRVLEKLSFSPAGEIVRDGAPHLLFRRRH